MRICFTGEVVASGSRIHRRTLETYAAQAGMQPVRSVTKRGCDVLVAADVASMSGKAKQARRYGIGVMSAEDFMSEVEVHSASFG